MRSPAQSTVRSARGIPGSDPHALRVPAFLGAKLPALCAFVRSRCDRFSHPAEFVRALEDAQVAWVALEAPEPPDFQWIAGLVRGHSVCSVAVLAPLTDRTARGLVRAGITDVLWWPDGVEEFDRVTQGLRFPGVGSLMDRVHRSAAAFDFPVGAALRKLCDSDTRVPTTIEALAVDMVLSDRTLRRPWREALSPWTPKVTLDWMLWMRAVGLYDHYGGEKRGVERIAFKLGIAASTLLAISRRRTGLDFPESAVEPGRGATIERFETEGRDAVGG